MTLADSSYEDWQKENPDSSFLDFQFSLEKMNVAGPLFDFVKIQNINNNYLSLLSTAELYAQGLGRAEKYSPALADLMKKYPDYTQKALNIERHTEKDPKRFTLYTDISKNLDITVTGPYLGIANFMYDIENNFKVSNFNMKKDEAKFQIRNIKILEEK